MSARAAGVAGRAPPWRGELLARLSEQPDGTTRTPQAAGRPGFAGAGYSPVVTRPLRVGVQLPEVERRVPWVEYSAIARAAEWAGFDSIWVGDHLLYRDAGGATRGPWDAWSILAGLAGSTSRVALGPLVTCTAFRLPGVFAKTVSTVDEMSGGRLVLGLGAGWNEEEFRAFGLPFKERVGLFEESFEVLRRLLSGETVTYHGAHVDLEEAVLDPRPERCPPLMVGSAGERVLRATLPHADSWNTWYDGYGNTPEGFARLNGEISRAAERVGRDPSQILRSACVFVVTDRARAERPLTDDAPAWEGSAELIAGRLRELAEAGADEAILVVSPIDERSVRSLAEVLALLDAT